jgi:hypothetical protein
MNKNHLDIFIGLGSHAIFEKCLEDGKSVEGSAGAGFDDSVNVGGCDGDGEAEKNGEETVDHDLVFLIFVRCQCLEMRMVDAVAVMPATGL